jgi:2-C-methyl-D-erythritol 4-phosphate cytidylyltransferase
VSSYWLVMPAAGSGRRFGGPKQHARLVGRTVLETALQLFIGDDRCQGGSIVYAPTDTQISSLRARLPERFALVPGGSERARSVYNGLLALEPRARPQDWVLVHDAARPCLSAVDRDRLLERGASDAVGALLALPVADTIKRAASAGTSRVDATVSREGLWLAQTPQMFRYAPLRAALERAASESRVPTDEAQAMEWMGQSAQLVAATDSNFKVTHAADLALAAAILQAREEGRCG